MKVSTGFVNVIRHMFVFISLIRCEMLRIHFAKQKYNLNFVLKMWSIITCKIHQGGYHEFFICSIRSNLENSIKICIIRLFLFWSEPQDSPELLPVPWLPPGNPPFKVPVFLVIPFFFSVNGKDLPTVLLILIRAFGCQLAGVVEF